MRISGTAWRNGFRKVLVLPRRIFGRRFAAFCVLSKRSSPTEFAYSLLFGTFREQPYWPMFTSKTTPRFSIASNINTYSVENDRGGGVLETYANS